MLLVFLANIGATASIQHAITARMRAGGGVPLSPPASAKSTFSAGGDKAGSGGTQSWCGPKENVGSSGI